jgi:drug/metabolite transporter (DMT)-like permease
VQQPRLAGYSIAALIHLVALLGILSISFSAVFVRLAAVSPVTATFFRAAYALPLLVVLWTVQRRRDRRTRRERWLAFASGLVLAVDLDLWHESIVLIGAGLSTVIANTQVIFVAAAARVLYRERLSPLRWVLILVVLGGVALTSGLGRADAYGARPATGVVLGVLAGLSYSTFLLIFREANKTESRLGPLLDSTIGTAIGALASTVIDPHFTLLPPASAQLWLVLLAIGSQVIGWLLIGAALPKLPAVETSVLLVGQPVVTVIWGVLIFGEHLSRLQWTGAAVVVAGVAALSTTGGTDRLASHREHGEEHAEERGREFPRVLSGSPSDR